MDDEGKLARSLAIAVAASIGLMGASLVYLVKSYYF